MAAPNNFFHALLLLLSVITLVSLSLNSAATLTPLAKPSRLVIKLIHRDSILSPYYDPKLTLEERAQRAIDHTIARATYIQESIRTTQIGIDDYRAPLVADNVEAVFLANISIGRPPVPQLLLVDTGSPLLWVQCQPCTTCIRQSVPMYDPSKSSTYASLPCSSVLCEFVLNIKCISDFCVYAHTYGDGSKSVGNLGSEELVLVTSDDGIVTVPIEVFGCAHENSGNFGNKYSGIFGLSASSQFILDNGVKFSYCLGDISDPLYMYNQLIIGNNANLDGHTTPLDTFNDRYYLTLEGISVGDKKLDINPAVFQRKPSGEGGVVIDSGTNYLLLTSDVFNPFLDEIRRVIGGRVREVQNPNITTICYRGDLQRDLNGFPMVTFHFAEGADLVLDNKSMFFRAAREAFCLAALSNDDKTGLSIIGAIAQQSYNFGYEILREKLYIQKIECALLDE